MVESVRSGRLTSFIIACVLAIGPAGSSQASAQVVDNRGFIALPRPIHYATPLAPSNGAKAIIVYGKLAPWTQTAALAVQTAIQDWCGLKLELADDCTVTSDETWLLADAYRTTPLIVLGNAQDNRVMHALGTRQLLQSNHMWPGGDRFLIRTVFEPFVADVNYITLEASTAAGLDGAAAKFKGLLKTFPGVPSTVPFTRVVGGGQDIWPADNWVWQVPKGYEGDPNRTAAQIAKDFKGTPEIASGGLNYGDPWAYVLGGHAGGRTPILVDMPPEKLRTSAAVLLNGGRSVGGRTHVPGDHYSCVKLLLGMRSVIQAGVLDEAAVNELENFMVLSAAYPNEYWYDRIGSDCGFIDAVGCRHSGATTLFTINLLDYVRHHCRMDDTTRKEVERRAEGAHKTVAHFVKGYRDNVDDWELGETTLMWLSAMLHEGMPDPVKNGALRKMADTFVMTTDNLPDVGNIMPGRYAGLDCYIGAQPGMTTGSWHGRGLLPAAAFYYDDPQYRWLTRQGTGVMEGPHNSVATPMLMMHWNTEGDVKEPTMYNGVRALPFDERLYDIVARQASGQGTRWIAHALKIPAPRERCVDRIAFRDGMQPQDAYMFFATNQRLDGNTSLPLHNNALARYTDLGELWLFHNCMRNTGWSRNVVSISNGRPYQPEIGCTLEALANLGDFSIAAARENEVSGAAWTRSVIHWRGHYFAVLDRIEALADDNFNMVCRWRSLQPASLQGRVWRAYAPSGSSLRIQATDPAPQTSEFWDCDGAARPNVLSQYKHAKLSKGQAETYQNLLSVSGDTRPDDFSARRVSANAMLVKGTTAGGDHLALIGTAQSGSLQADGAMPLPKFQTDAAVFVVAGNRLHLAGVTSLRVKTGLKWRDILRTDRPLNLLLDCGTKQGELEVPEDIAVQASVCGVASTRKGKSAFTVPEDQALPVPGLLLAALWNGAKDPQDLSVAKSAAEKPVFERIDGGGNLRLDRRRLSPIAIDSVPASLQPIRTLSDGECCANLPGNGPTWRNTENLEIKLQLRESTPVSHLRLVGILNGLDFKFFGQKWNEADDFKFSLVLSDDGFQKDNRVIESPKVSFEETAIYPVVHYALGRLPTWRIEVNAKAKAIKILPRATKKDKPDVSLTEIEAYGPEAAASVNVRAFAVDLDGDGGNELVIGSSCKEVAAFDAQGKRLWSNAYSGDIFTMDCSDLDADGKTEALVYTTDEKLHRVNGDGTERAVADIWKAQMDKWNYPGCGGMVALGAWGPDDVKKQEVVLFSEGYFRVEADGTPKNIVMAQARGAGRVPKLYPGEDEVLATIHTAVDLWSARRDAFGNYVHLGRGLETAGPSSAICMRGFGWINPVNLPAFKGILAANEGGLNYFPIEAFKVDATNSGWGYSTGGAPVTAALSQDLDGDGVPEVFLARQDGFVNVLRLANGQEQALLNVGGPVLGLAMLKDKHGKSCLAIGSRFGVRLFGSDLKEIGRCEMPATGFAGPGGKNKDRVFVVSPAGSVAVLVLK